MKVTILKKLLIILFLSPCLLVAQSTIYVSLQPVDMGYGLRFDKQYYKVGIYTSISRGEYRFIEGYVKDHYKAAIGAIYYIKGGFFTAGYNIHRYGESCGVNPDVFYPVSYEVGVGSVFDKFSVALRLDPVKWDSSIDIGLRF